MVAVMSSRAFYHLVKSDVLVFIRSRVGMFWTFAFPILALLAYVQLFSGPTLAGNTVVVSSERSTLAESYTSLLSRTLTDRGAAVAQSPGRQQPIGRVHISTAPGSSREQLRIDVTPTAGNPASFGLLAQTVSGFTGKWSARESRDLPAILSIADSQGTSPASRSTYIVPGLVVMVALSSALMGFAVPLVAAREFGITRQQSLWPVRAPRILLAWTISRFVVIAGSSALVIVFASMIYGFGGQSTAAGLMIAVLLLIIGSLTLLALGLVIAARVKSTQTALVISNIVYFCGIMTGNLIIPTSAFSPEMQSMLAYSPLNAVSDSMRIALTHTPGDSFWMEGLVSRVAIVIGFGVACFFIAATTYRWSAR